MFVSVLPSLSLPGYYPASNSPKYEHQSHHAEEHPDTFSDFVTLVCQETHPTQQVCGYQKLNYKVNNSAL